MSKTLSTVDEAYHQYLGGTPDDDEQADWLELKAQLRSHVEKFGEELIGEDEPQPIDGISSNARDILKKQQRENVPKLLEQMFGADEMKPNEKYGLTESYQHDLDSKEICKKCHQHISELALKACYVVGKDEFDKYRKGGQDERD